MTGKIKDLTVKDLKKLIRETVEEVLEDYFEDLIALSSKKFINSIKKAREDYRKGRVKSMEDVLNEL